MSYLQPDAEFRSVISVGDVVDVINKLLVDKIEVV